ncbi:MAG: hypothetical protein N2442_09140 [Spirochaetes bacterium]|nr:hypothetical protein [Spirochaetota bacterium]
MKPICRYGSLRVSLKWKVWAILWIGLVSVFYQVSWAEDLILATTSWTASFVEAAFPHLRGFKIVTLAGTDLRHPPEYELKPSDVVLLGNCTYFVFAGYEAMIPKIKQGSLRVGGTQVQIQTVNTPKVIRESVQKLSQLFGTEKEATKYIEQIEQFYRDWRKEVENTGLSSASVVCHAFLSPIAQELGLNIVGTYGPSPLEAVKIAELAGKQPRFILDNWHTDAGKPLIQALPGTPVVSFINFPGKEGTRSLLDVLSYNRDQLRKIAR